MSTIKNILNDIERLKETGEQLSKKNVIDILKAIKSVTANTQFIENLIFFYDTINREYLNKTSLLTHREKEILHLIGLGLLNKNISQQLHLRVTTIETHRKNIRKKLDLSGNGKLLKLAILHNLQTVTESIK